MTEFDEEFHRMMHQGLHPITAANFSTLPPNADNVYNLDRYSMCVEEEKDVSEGHDAYEHRTASICPASAATPPTCSKLCKECSTQYRTVPMQYYPWMRYRAVHNDDEARTLISKHIQAIHRNLASVTHNLQTHGNAFLKRWAKKPIAKRIACLKEAFPQIPQRRHHHAEHLRQVLIHTTFDPHIASDYYEGFLNQFLDLDSLSQDPWRLLALVHFRTRFSPSEWIRWDLRQLGIPFAEGGLRLGYNPHCVVMTSEGFGELVQWTEEAAHCREVVGFPLAEVALQAQAQLARFLASLVDKVLEGSDAGPGDEKWMAKVLEFEAVSASKGSLFPLPFSAPPRLIPERLMEVIGARVADAEKDLWRAQIDPEYLRQLLLTVKASTWYAQQSEATRNGYLIKMSVGCAVRLEAWRQIHFYATVASNTPHHEPEFEKALLLLQSELVYLSRCQVAGLEGLNTTLPPFAQLFGVDSHKDPKLDRSWDAQYGDDPLFWVIYHLHERLPAYDAGFLHSFLREQMDKRTQRKRPALHPLLEALLEDMAATHEAIEMLASYPLPLHDETQLNDLRDEFYRRDDWLAFPKRINAVIRPLKVGEDTLIKRTNELMALPAPSKKVTREELERFEEGHVRLGRFWTDAVEIMKGLFDDFPPLPREEEAIQTWLESLFPCRSEEYQAQVAREREQLEKSLDEAPPASSGQQGESQEPTCLPLRLTRTEEHTAPSETTPAREKIKTRGLPLPEPLPPEPPAEEEPPQPREPAPPQIPVHRDTYELFQRMFRPGECTKRTASVSWTAIEAAFGDAGCTMEQRQGSAVAFLQPASSRSGSRAGAVVIHRRHPDPRVNPIALREIGGKVGKYFGWTEESFVVRKGGRE
ncbi:hypothetical protein KC332_g13302 [Hortaea werneckii]|nr:hypothetical protein KC350_g14493 [Hortaea werneckii]KAI6823200.1 hypothetical protein KC358_g8613 [Hortaea werneckii]KAI6909226.1 hypothetical protein KC348_g13557 [Hortaea werneckii]KAI6923728.1 hypothetical protein KC341_g14532 [Hortaea werneckii]KAI6967790.1 hypothetical protein KC321_g8825 [Hortaea werneckii]